MSEAHHPVNGRPMRLVEMPEHPDTYVDSCESCACNNGFVCAFVQHFVPSALLCGARQVFRYTDGGQ